MWEAIQRNRLKSFVLISSMGFFLLLLGASLGTVFSASRQGAFAGVFIAAAVWFFLTLIALSQGHKILLAFSGAREISHDEAPQLYNIVEEMRIAAALPSTPKVFIMESGAPNAFAVGHGENTAVAVTTGLLSVLDRDELQGVIAHEIGHIKNQDSKFMTTAGVLLGTIVILADLTTRSFFFGGMGTRRSQSDRDSSNQIQMLLIVVALLLAILAPLLAQMLYFACSRSREYLADASAALFTRYPEALASALEKISNAHIPLENANRVTAPMYIINPLAANSSQAFSLFSTHPPTEERVNILRTMAGGAGLADYRRAYMESTGKDISLGGGMPSSGQLELRGIKKKEMEAAPANSHSELKKRTRDAFDILHRLNKFVFITCDCGLKIKVPPGFVGNSVNCPKCGKSHKIDG